MIPYFINLNQKTQEIDFLCTHVGNWYICTVFWSLAGLGHLCRGCIRFSNPSYRGYKLLLTNWTSQVGIMCQTQVAWVYSPFTMILYMYMYSPRAFCTLIPIGWLRQSIAAHPVSYTPVLRRNINLLLITLLIKICGI